MAKKGIIVIAITATVALITVFAAFGLNCFDQPPPDILEEQPPHRPYLEEFLADTGLTFVPILSNDFAYYKLHTADEQLAGFVFLGTEDGWAGPISLFVKTDAAGIIQRVHVWHHTETPIYVVGMDAFLATFAGYKAEAELIWQEDVHGITGATVTAEAIITAVYGPGRAARQKGVFIQRER
ncbi:MAG: Electron transport complex subunit RsxG [Chloroflexi bacterium]|nr:Electron transport complex subunit RsxG [Chloroflexota bacterium]